MAPWLALCAVTPLLVAVNPNWIFSPAHSIDPWVYHGFIRDYPLYVGVLFPDTYYGSRLAWILPGHLAYELLPPVPANLLFHGAFHLAAVCSVHAIALRAGDRTWAFGVAATFACASPVLTVYGWDYVDGGVITYFLAAAAFATRASHATWPVAATGAALAAMIHSNIGAALLAPAPLLLLLGRRSAAERARACVFAAAGAIALTFALAAISASLGGGWWFFAPSVSWVLAGATTSGRAPGVSWVPSATWLIVPATITAMIVARRVRGPMTPQGASASLGFVWCFGAMIAFDLAGGALLQTPYYASWLLAPAVVCFALAFRPPSPAAGIVPGVLGVLAVTFVLLSGYDNIGTLLTSTGASELSVIWVRRVLATAVVAYAAFVAAAARGHAPLLLTVGCASMTILPLPSTRAIDEFRAVGSAMSVIRLFAQRTPPKIWFDAREPQAGSSYTAIASAYLWEYSLLNYAFPTMSQGDRNRLAPGDTIVVLSRAPDAALRARAALEASGFTAAVAARSTVESPSGPFGITILRLSNGGA